MDSFVLDFFKANDVNYYENYPMSHLTPIRIGGFCDVAVFPDSESKLVAVVKFLIKNGIPYKIVGKMSNILPTDCRYEGVIVATDKVRVFGITDSGVSLSAGATLRGVLPALIELRLSGYEELVGIPGCIGGLVTGNAGAFSRETSDLVESVRAIELESFEEVTLYPKSLAFSYRNSLFKSSEYLILEVCFSLVHSNKEAVKARIDECKKMRAKTQPIEFPSLGSTFKRCVDVPAAKLIDKCGLKGRRIGGAMVSEKHAGFIINESGATEKDVKALIDLVSKTVFDCCGVSLEREIEYLGD